MIKGIDKRLKQQMSAFRTKNVKVYISVSPAPPDTRSNFERISCDGVYEDPEEVAGKLMDLSLTHYVWDWSASEKSGGYGKKWLAIELVLTPSTNYKTNIDAELIEQILNRMEGTTNV